MGSRQHRLTSEVLLSRPGGFIVLKTWSVFDSAVVPERAAPTPFVSRQSSSGLGAAWVYAAGELDIFTASQLEQTLDEALQGARLVVLDLRELSFVDSAGVHVIVDAGVRARRAGSRLMVVRASSQVDAVFTLIGVTEDVEIYDLDPAEPPVQSLLQLVPEAPMA